MTDDLILWSPVACSPDSTALFLYNYSADNNEEGYWILSTDGKNKKKIFGEENIIISSVNWSPDSQKIALVGKIKDEEEWEIYILNAADGTKKASLIKHLKDFIHRCVDWLSNNKIVFTDGKTISTINIDESDQKQIFP